MRKRMIERIQDGLRKCVEEPNRFHRLGHMKNHADGELIHQKMVEVDRLSDQIFPAGKWRLVRVEELFLNRKILRIYGCLGEPPGWSDYEGRQLKSANALLGEED